VDSDLPLSHLNTSAEDLSKPLPISLTRYVATSFRKLKYRNQDISPFLSGDSFASLTDYVAFGRNGTSKFDADKAMQAKSIFVKSHMLEKLEAEGRKIGIKPDVIVSGNSDRNFVRPRPQPLDCRLWLCQNNAIKSTSALRTLPIGLENMRLGRLGQKKFYLEPERKTNFKSTKILVPPMKPTNPQRLTAVARALKYPKLYDVRREYLGPEAYFRSLKEFQFVLCLEGNGFENHRIWECLYLQIFPVVIASPWSLTLRDLGLPILFIDSIDAVTPRQLDEFLEHHADFRSEETEVMWTPYWKSLIDSATL
jgi:hypothetical protein